MVDVRQQEPERPEVCSMIVTGPHNRQPRPDSIGDGNLPFSASELALFLLGNSALL